MPKRNRIDDIETRLRVRREVTDTGCWLWTGQLNNQGYGQTSQRSKLVLVHRLSYEMANGRIPDGLVIDHLCRVRACFNPDHLEPVTNRVNTFRSAIATATVNASKTHCPQGHEYNEANTLVWVHTKRSSTERRCKICKAEYDRARSARRAAAVVEVTR